MCWLALACDGHQRETACTWYTSTTVTYSHQPNQATHTHNLITDTHIQAYTTSAFFYTLTAMDQIKKVCFPSSLSSTGVGKARMLSRDTHLLKPIR